MDYYQGVVLEYLRADRSVFVNPEYLIQLDEGVAKKGRHWYCDILAVSFRTPRAIYLCEVTYSSTAHALLRRLKEWDANWTEICDAVSKNCGGTSGWQICPWVFLPKEVLEKQYQKKLSQFLPPRTQQQQMPLPRVTALEKVAPWRYKWDRITDNLESVHSASDTGQVEM